MLTQLHIENIAVIKKASIPLEQGFNVFTGETGAGKTILISAIDAVLGERTSRDIIRTGEEKALVSALFEDISPSAKATLEEMGYEAEDNSVLVFREMTIGGKNVCKINGMPANVSILKAISGQLIHIHGQRDSEQLLTKEHHVEMIDTFGELGGLRSQYQEKYRKYKELEIKLNALSMDESQKAQRLDMLQFQINEIVAAKLEDVNEEELLQVKRRTIQGSERIQNGFASAYLTWQGTDDTPGIQEQLGIMQSGINEVAHFMEEYSLTGQRLDEIIFELQELAGDVSHSLEGFEFDPKELDSIEYRLNDIYKLKQKYGESIEEILLHYDTISAEYDGIATNEEQQEKVRKELLQRKTEAEGLAKELSTKRIHFAKKFTTAIEEELAFLDMPTVSFSLAHQVRELREKGIDDLEFLIVTNVGEVPKPLNKIASGGEISRIMLAIKNVLADKDDIDSLIFDEVDTGVSGRAAGKIGKKLSEVSKNRQVICVTHLAQVAAFGDNHLLIAKESDGDHTYTKVTTLTQKEAVYELARITSGEVITEAALQSAEELWDRAHKN